MPRISEVFEDVRLNVLVHSRRGRPRLGRWAAAILYWRAPGSNQSWWKRGDLSSSSDSRMIRCSDAVSGVSDLARAWMLVFQFSLSDKCHVKLEEPTLKLASMARQPSATFKDSDCNYQHGLILVITAVKLLNSPRPNKTCSHCHLRCLDSCGTA